MMSSCTNSGQEQKIYLSSKSRLIASSESLRCQKVLIELHKQDSSRQMLLSANRNSIRNSTSLIYESQILARIAV